MDYRVSARKTAVAQALISRDLLREEAPLVGVIDMEALDAVIGSLKRAFPAHFSHAFAAKANSMPGVLAHVRGAGMACEVASPNEFAAAVDAGFQPMDIVFDSPAKTRSELHRALGVGTVLYVDNFQELARVDELLRNTSSTATIGARINPQVGAGSITSTSTASATSKFGIALGDPGNRDALIAAFLARPWLTSLHVHVGSQGCPLDLTVQGVRAVVDLANAIDAACGQRRISTLDIGGGLPVNFADDTVHPTFDDYATLLRDTVPELFDGSMRVITEFGRSVIAKVGFILARVEYTKTMGGRRVAITHAGAQVAARTVYQPDTWPLRISALDEQGRPKPGVAVEQDVAGPCCFAGDILAHRRALPLLEPGDHVLIHDTGGYYFSSPYIYNSLPPIDAYAVAGPDQQFEIVSLG
ncbi:MAG: diaminopimelate decarboxylase [Steroidobacteraceae bacterium]